MHGCIFINYKSLKTQWNVPTKTLARHVELMKLTVFIT